MSKDLGVKKVRLDEIDDQAIPKIRLVDEASEDYRILENAINKDGQRNPITLRLLTDEEKSKAREGAIYGIIDGHHRFHIACKFNRETILSEVDDTPSDPIRDAMLAFRMNTTSIRMSPIEKGKVICYLMKETGADVNEIGRRVFGLKTAMIYRSIQKYKESIGESTVKKSRKSYDKFDSKICQKTLTELFGGVGEDFIVHNRFDTNDEETRKEKLKLVKSIKKQLTLLEKQLSVAKV